MLGSPRCVTTGPGALTFLLRPAKERREKMRRRNAVTLFVIVGALLVASVASVAVAKNISCNKARCVGTNEEV